MDDGVSNEMRQMIHAGLAVLSRSDGLGAQEGWASRALGMLSNSGLPRNEIVSVVGDMLGTRDHEMRRAAVLILGHLGRESIDELGSMIDLISDGEDRLCEEAAWAVMNVCAEAAPSENVQAQIVERLALPLTRPVAEFCARALGEADLPLRLQEVIRVLSTTASPDVRPAVLELIGRTAKPSEALLRSLLESATDSGAAIRRSAAFALAEVFREEAKPLVLESLIDLAADESILVRLVAVGGLGRVEVSTEYRERVSVTLAVRLMDEGKVFDNATWALSQQQLGAPEVMKALMMAIPREDRPGLISALWALVQKASGAEDLGLARNSMDDAGVAAVAAALESEVDSSEARSVLELLART